MKKGLKQKIISRPTWKAGQECWQHRWIYVIVCVASILLSFIISSLSTKKYSAQVILANEHKEHDIILGLDNWTAFIRQQKQAFGQPEGLKNPEVYANIIESDSFLTELAHIYLPVVHKTYSDYLKQFDNRETITDEISDNLSYLVSSRYGTITLEVTDRNPVVAALMVDSAKDHLQRNIRRLQYQNLDSTYLSDKRKFELAHKFYEEKQKEYADYCDNHQDVILNGERTEAETLRKDRDEAFTAYQKAAIQYERSRALAIRNSPSFALVKNATVPEEPSSPQPIGITLSLLVIGIIFTTWGILFNRHIKENKNIR